MMQLVDCRILRIPLRAVFLLSRSGSVAVTSIGNKCTINNYVCSKNLVGGRRRRARRTHPKRLHRRERDTHNHRNRHQRRGQESQSKPSDILNPLIQGSRVRVSLIDPHTDHAQDQADATEIDRRAHRRRAQKMGQIRYRKGEQGGSRSCDDHRRRERRAQVDRREQGTPARTAHLPP